LKGVVSQLYKRISDLAVLTLAHIMLAPVWALLWIFIPLAIWVEDRGPVFFYQTRVGKDGKLFMLRKFRTMYVDQGQKDHQPTVLATENDPRVTRVGRLLRGTALDELPQILAIAQGQMSLVGPRPEPPDVSEQILQLASNANLRLSVLPGLTGLAQVYSGYGAPLDQKLKYDLEYVSRMSLWLDWKLIALSIIKTVKGSWEGSITNPRDNEK
jgi:lipopolysaccharide/colanic/teichoic acid biosynthesis glycosyltransferase